MHLKYSYNNLVKIGNQEFVPKWAVNWLENKDKCKIVLRLNRIKNTFRRVNFVARRVEIHKISLDAPEMWRNTKRSPSKGWRTFREAPKRIEELKRRERLRRRTEEQLLWVLSDVRKVFYSPKTGQWGVFSSKGAFSPSYNPRDWQKRVPTHAGRVKSDNLVFCIPFHEIIILASMTL